jgi:diketogulonate reductase-like aldo/keto reductase
VAHLEENTAAAGLELSAENWAELESAASAKLAAARRGVE